jgi:hypothetical protein
MKRSSSTAELGVGLLVLKHIFRPDLRARLPEVMSLWYTLRQQEHALRYLEAVIRYVTSAGQRCQAQRMYGRRLRSLRPGRRCNDRYNCTRVDSTRAATSGCNSGEQRGEQRAACARGLLTGIRLGLKLKFGLAGAALMTEIAQIEDVALLQTIGDAIELADTPDQVRALYRGG